MMAYLSLLEWATLRGLYNTCSGFSFGIQQQTNDLKCKRTFKYVLIWGFNVLPPWSQIFKKSTWTVKIQVLEHAEDVFSLVNRK